MLPHHLMLIFMLTTLLAGATIANKIIFIVLILWTIALLLRSSSPKQPLVWPAFCIISIFLYGYLLSNLFPSDRSLATQFFLATSVLILIHFVEFYKINLDQSVELCGKIMILVSALYRFLYLNPSLPFAQDIYLWFQDISQSAYSERDYLGGDTSVQTISLGTAPFLYIPWCLLVVRILRSFSWSDLIWLTLYGWTIVTSGMRGVIVAAIIFLTYAGLTHKSSIIRLMLWIIFSALFITILPEIFSNTELFSNKEESNQAKIGHFQSYLDQLSWSNAFFGSGLGNYYFSKGKWMLMPHTELTPIDLARYFGIPLAITVFGLMLFPRFHRHPFKGQRHLVFATFAIYLILSITNPVLINSYGLLIVVWYWAKYREFAYGSSVQHPSISMTRGPTKSEFNS